MEQRELTRENRLELGFLSRDGVCRVQKSAFAPCVCVHQVHSQYHIGHVCCLKNLPPPPCGSSTPSQHPSPAGSRGEHGGRGEQLTCCCGSDVDDAVGGGERRWLATPTPRLDSIDGMGMCSGAGELVCAPEAHTAAAGAAPLAALAAWLLTTSSSTVLARGCFCGCCWEAEEE